MKLTHLILPLFATALLTTGIGSFATLTTLQLQSMHYSIWAIGWIASLYFAGMIVGSYCAQGLIVRLHHRQAYFVFALMIAMAALLQGLVPNAWLWAITRFMGAFCLAGLFVVIESWLLAASDDRHKGQVMAFYLLIYYSFQALSQLWLKLHYSEVWMPFALVAVWVAVSIVPVMFAKQTVPIPKHTKLASPWVFIKLAPFGMTSALVAGLMFAMVYTLYPLFLAKAGLSTSEIASLMSITIIGGALLQLPIGKISDHFDRRLVLITVGLNIAVIALLMAFTYQHYAILEMLSFIIGGLIFVIYPISISHASDCVGKELAISAVSIITIVYSVGSMVGPLIMSALMSGLGENGFFVYIILAGSLMGGFGTYNMIKTSRQSKAKVSM